MYARVAGRRRRCRAGRARARTAQARARDHRRPARDDPRQPRHNSPAWARSSRSPADAWRSPTRPCSASGRRRSLRRLRLDGRRTQAVPGSRSRSTSVLEDESKPAGRPSRTTAAKLASNNRIVLLVAALAQLALLGIVVVVSERQIAIRLAAESARGRCGEALAAHRAGRARADRDARSPPAHVAGEHRLRRALRLRSRKRPACAARSSIGDGAWGDTALLQRLSGRDRARPRTMGLRTDPAHRRWHRSLRGDQRPPHRAARQRRPGPAVDGERHHRASAGGAEGQ